MHHPRFAASTRSLHHADDELPNYFIAFEDRDSNEQKNSLRSSLLLGVIVSVLGWSALAASLYSLWALVGR